MRQPNQLFPQFNTAFNSSLDMSKIKTYKQLRQHLGLSKNHAFFDAVSANMMASRQLGLDSEGSIFFLRQLEFIKSELYNVQYADLTYSNIFPVQTDAPPGARSITYRGYDRRGSAKIIANAADDFPRADVTGKEINVPIKMIGASYAYDIAELQSSTYAGGQPLDELRAQAAMRAMQEQLNILSYFGAPEYGLDGLFSNTLIPRGSVADGASGNTQWSTKTPAEIILDVNTLTSSVVQNSKMIERPDTICVPQKQYDILNNTPLNFSGANISLLNYFLTQNIYITSREKVVPLLELEGAVTACNAAVPGGITGNDSNDLMFVYKKDPLKLAVQIPLYPTELPPEARNAAFIINMYGYCAGLIVYRPMSIAFAGGI